jgi:membrane-associated phospholipid phosphatase
MKYTNYFKEVTGNTLRDFSGLGNFVIIVMVLSVALSYDYGLLLRAVIGLFILLMACNVIKAVFPKNRPVKMSHTNILEKMEAGSFPSIHSAHIMYLSMVVIHFVNSALVDILFAIAIVVVGYSRYYLKKHFFIDIIAGYAIGLAAYTIVF